MKSKTRTNLTVLTECSIMIALSVVLSVFKLFEMPYGGSITLASFLPIVVVAYRHGTKYGLCSAGAASLMQMLLGLKNFSYFTTVGSFIALAVFDYVLAFSVFGLSGIFKKRVKSQNLAMAIGASLASILRYACHVISGATVWAGLSIPTEAALLYSLSYNATYMIPESIILVMTALYIGSALDFRSTVPTRMKSEALDKRTAYLYTFAGLSLLIALIWDTIIVFSRLQNYDSGEFMITALASVNWLLFSIVSAVGILIAAVLIATAKYLSKKNA